jgi:hypothetical protein
MFTIAPDLEAAALAGRDRLAQLTRRAALRGTGASSSSRDAAGTEAAMAAVAREAIFADALLAAVHARFAELKTAAK